MSRVLVRLPSNLNTLEERQFHQEVALYSFIAESGFFAGNFAEISSLMKVYWVLASRQTVVCLVLFSLGDKSNL